MQNQKLGNYSKIDLRLLNLGGWVTGPLIQGLRPEGGQFT